MVENHPAVSRVREVISQSNFPFEMKIFEEGTHTAIAAAEALSVEIGQIASSIVFKVITNDEEVPLLVITSGQHKVDTEKVASHLGVEKVHRADAEFVRRFSGFAIGGVAPVGWNEMPRALIDTALKPFSTIWAAAGHPATVFATTFTQLQDLAKAEPLDVGLK